MLIIHDWDGLTDYEMKRADMLAGLGYDAFALDLFGKGNRPVETAAKKKETGLLYDDRERMRTLMLAGLQEARKGGNAKTVAMGYCFGGAAVLELARSGKAEGISGYVSFHGGLATPQGQTYPSSTPPILIAHGGADASVSMEDVAVLSQELESAGVPYEIRIYLERRTALPISDRRDTRSAPTNYRGMRFWISSRQICAGAKRRRASRYQRAWLAGFSSDLGFSAVCPAPAADHGEKGIVGLDRRQVLNLSSTKARFSKALSAIRLPTAANFKDMNFSNLRFLGSRPSCAETGHARSSQFGAVAFATLPATKKCGARHRGGSDKFQALPSCDCW